MGKEVKAENKEGLNNKIKKIEFGETLKRGGNTNKSGLDNTKDYEKIKVKIKRKLTQTEVNIIKETIEYLFAKHYMAIGYDFREADINVFNHFVEKNRKEIKKQLPEEINLIYCYNIIQDLLNSVKLLRYEQRTITRYILRSHLILQTLCYEPKEVTKEKKKKLDSDLIQVINLIAESEALMQFVIMIFEILEIDGTKYKDVVNYYFDEEYKKYDEYTLKEYLQNNIFWEDIFEKLDEVKKFLFKDNNKNYKAILKQLERTKTEEGTHINWILKTLYSLNKETLNNLYNTQVSLEEHNNKIGTNFFKTYFYNWCEISFYKKGIEYQNTIRDYYQEQILLEGAKFKDE